MLSKKAVRTIAAVIAIILVVTLAAGSLFSAIGTAQAASVSDLKTQLSSIDKQKEEIQAVLDDLEGQMGSTTQKLQALQDQLNLTQEDITATEEVIERLEDEIATKEEEIEVAQKELDEKTELFETRMRVMYENGNEIGYLDVLFGSRSFGEMLSRMETVSEIMDNDKKIVEDYKEAKTKLETAKAEYEEDKQDQEEYKESLESKYDDLDSQREEVQALSDELESNYDKSKSEYEALTAEQDAINAEIEELSRQEAEAARKAAEEAKKNQSSGSSGSSGGSSVSYTGNGELSVWPAPSGVANTSSYGWRIHPIYGTRKFHKGLDISAPSGSPVLAAASGTVVQSYYSSSYGNYTVISHGGGLMTAYAHQTSRYVSVGETVSAGQQIGTIGSTGNSTGPHLHFEVYVNGSTVNPLNYY